MEVGNKSLGEFIKDRRNELGLTPNALHTKSGLSRTEILRIEDGTRRQPSLQNLRRLSYALNVEYSTLLRLAGYERMPEQSSLQFEYPVLQKLSALAFFEQMLDLITEHPELDQLEFFRILNYARFEIWQKESSEKIKTKD